jgi:hypothetical protein
MIQQAPDAAVFAELERIQAAHLQCPLDRFGSLQLAGCAAQGPGQRLDRVGS